LAYELLKLVVALLDDKDLQQRFNEQPLKTVKDFGLSDEQRGTLYTMDRDRIALAVADEIASLEGRIRASEPDEDSFPRCSEDYTPDVNLITAEYPSPRPALFRLRPRVHTREQDVSGPKPLKRLEVVVTGQSFSRKPNAKLVITALDGQATTPRVSNHVFGTFRCSRIVGRLTPATGAQAIEPGRYSFHVVNSPGTANEEDVLPDATQTDDFKLLIK
jgi:hypothetical protein